jgi:hypothetical protein
VRATVLLLVLALAPSAASAQSAPAARPATATATAKLTVDSPLGALAADPRTSAVLRKHLPGFLERMEESQALYDMLSGITFRELENEPHVRGVTPAVIDYVDKELAKAQSAPQ